MSAAAVPTGLRRPRALVRRAALAKVGEGLTLAAMAVLLPRALSTEAFAQLGVALAAVSIGATATALGGPALFARLLPTVEPGRRPALARALASRVGRTRLAWAAVAATAIAAGALASPEVLPPVDAALIAAALLCSVLATLLLQVGIGLGRVGPWLARYGIENLLIVCLAIALAAPFGGTGAVAGVTIACAASLALGLWAAAPQLRAPGRPGPIPGEWLAFGRRQAVAGGLTQLGLRGSVPVAALVAGSAETADAALATGIVAAAFFAVLQLFVVLMPAGISDPRGLEGRLRRLAVATGAVAAPAAIALALAAPAFTEPVFGSEYEGAVGALQVGFAALALAPLWSWLSQRAVIEMRATLQVAAALAGAAAFAVAVVPATGTHGAEGAVASAVLSLAVASAVLAAGVSRRGRA